MKSEYYFKNLTYTLIRAWFPHFWRESSPNLSEKRMVTAMKLLITKSTSFTRSTIMDLYSQHIAQYFPWYHRFTPVIVNLDFTFVWCPSVIRSDWPIGQ